MKKSIFLKVTTALVAVAFLAACGKDDNKKKDDDDDDDPTIESAITIDGKFTDWDDAGAIEFKINENAAKQDLKVLKLLAEPAFLNVYMEFDKAVLSSSAGGTPTHMYIDIDGQETGYNNPDVSANYFNYHIEGSINGWENANDFTLIDLKLFKWPNDAMTQADPWASSGAELGTGFAQGNGVIVGNIVKYEYQITRELLPEAFPSTIRVSFDIQTSWNATGVLPVNAEGEGISYSSVVQIVGVR